MKALNEIIKYEIKSTLLSIRFVSLAVLVLALITVANSSSFLQILLASLAGMRGEVQLVLVVPYYLLAWLIPIMALVLSYDSISGGIAQGTLKLIATKATRTKIIIGKYIASLATLLILILLCYGINIFKTLASTGIFIGTGAMPLIAYQFLIAAAWLSLVFLFSSIFSQPSSALNASIIAIVLLQAFSYTSWSLDHYSLCALKSGTIMCMVWVFAWLAAMMLLAVIAFKRRSL